MFGNIIWGDPFRLSHLYIFSFSWLEWSKRVHFDNILFSKINKWTGSIKKKIFVKKFNCDHLGEEQASRGEDQKKELDWIPEQDHRRANNPDARKIDKVDSFKDDGWEGRV